MNRNGDSHLFMHDRLENSHQSQHYAQQNKRACHRGNRPDEQELVPRRLPILIMIGKLRSISRRPKIFTEIEAVLAVKDDRSNAPIPAVSAKAAHEAQANQQLNSIFTQSSFPINIAIFVQMVHRQIGVLLHPLPHDKPDRVVSRHSEFAGQVA